MSSGDDGCAWGQDVLVGRDGSPEVASGRKVRIKSSRGRKTQL